ncbi:hypothetical protein B0T16DRAFT_454842 [Cercophora newfieldiana]|uniref:J domain-containing protein n=1 Tax=Cercophora newfieldiana TaxID=92897 RepID=A0AA40CX70_9PEZI|nr:hypothetical protein B0T16DRAFT_454842 [Cercophora newfieldiana]
MASFSDKGNKQFVDYYAVLGVEHTATTREIKKVFEERGYKALNTPIFDDDDEEPGYTRPSTRYDRLREAFNVLTDMARRSAFDIAREELELEKHRKKLSIPKRMEHSINPNAPLPRDTILYWLQKLQLSMNSLLWHRLDKIERILQSPLINKILLHEFYLWQDEANLCWRRLVQLKREIDVKTEWDETSPWVTLMGREVLKLRNCCVFWVDLANRILESAEEYFAEDGFFKRPDDWVELRMCEGKLCAVMMWEEFRVPEPSTCS